MKNYINKKQLCWEALKANPTSSANDLAKLCPALGNQKVATAILSMLYRSRLVDRVKARNAGEVLCYYYSAVGAQYVESPMVIPQKFFKRKSSAKDSYVAMAQAPIPQMHAPLSNESVIQRFAQNAPLLTAPHPMHSVSVTMTEAEEFKAWMQFKAMKKAGVL